MKQGQYLVTGMVGNSKEGDILNCYILCEGDSNTYLVYLPKIDKYDCPCFVICYKDSDGFYINSDEDLYCNVVRADKKFKEFMQQNTPRIKRQKTPVSIKVEMDTDKLKEDIENTKRVIKETSEEIVKEFIGKLTKTLGKYLA
jgi:hypothetical protein